jgi:hypothetical protein
MRIERHVVLWIASLVVFVGLLCLPKPILLPFVVGSAAA